MAHTWLWKLGPTVFCRWSCSRTIWLSLVEKEPVVCFVKVQLNSGVLVVRCCPRVSKGVYSFPELSISGTTGGFHSMTNCFENLAKCFTIFFSWPIPVYFFIYFLFRFVFFLSLTFCIPTSLFVRSGALRRNWVFAVAAIRSSYLGWLSSCFSLSRQCYQRRFE